MRADEDFAKQQFDNYLIQKTSESIHWDDGDQNVPPDFYLKVGEKNYVVEVTTIAEQVETSKNTVPRLTLHGSVDAYVETIKMEATRRNILNGKYFVTFTKDFYKKRKRLQKEIIDYIGKTQSDQESKRIEIEIDNVKYCSIKKSTNIGSDIMLGFYPVTAKWEIESVYEAEALLQGAIDSKIKSLSDFSEDKILLLLAEYVFVQPEVYKRILPKISGLQNFHTIFMVYSSDESSNYILYSENPQWA